MLKWWRRVSGRGVPEGFTGSLAPDELVLAFAALPDGRHLVATSLGLWLPDGRMVGWHLISKATWGGNALTVIEAVVTGEAGGAVLLEDQAPQRFALEEPGKLPQVVHERVTGSIKSRHRKDLPDGGAWFLQRKVPGQDGVVLQARPDPGTDVELVRSIAASVAAKMEELR